MTPQRGKLRNKALVAVAMLAFVAVLATSTLVWVWRSAFQEMDAYFKDSARARAKVMATFLAEELDTFRAGPEGLHWRTRFADATWRKLDAALRSKLQQVPMDLFLVVRDRESSLERSTTIPLIGQGESRRIDYAEGGDVDDAGFKVGFDRNAGDLIVFVSGPLPEVGGSNSDESATLFVSYAFPKLGVLERGQWYLLLLLGVFLTWLYVILVVVYVMGRRAARLRLRAQESSIRLNAMGSIAEGIAHEIRNPLNALSLATQYIERLPQKTGAMPSPTDFQLIYLEVGKIRRVIDNFVGFAKMREMELSHWDFDLLVKEALDRLAPVLAEKSIRVEHRADGETEVEADRTKIGQVLQSLLTNAVEVMEPVDERILGLTVQGGAESIRFAVRDTGPTPAPFVLRSMFDPYALTRSSVLGIGMTTARTVIESHGGTISAAAAEGGGCVVTIVLPR